MRIFVSLKERWLIQLYIKPAEEAYTVPIPPQFREPHQPDTATVTRFCPTAYTSPLKYSSISCNDVGDTASTKMEFLGAIILHEWFHNDAIGKAAIGVHIEDVDGLNGYGPVATRNMRNNRPNDCIRNADSYTWLALEIFWTKHCNHDDKIPYFKDPAGVTGSSTSTTDPQPSASGTPPSGNSNTKKFADPPAPAVCASPPTLPGAKDANPDKAKRVATQFCNLYAKDAVDSTGLKDVIKGVEKTLWVTENQMGGRTIEQVQEWTRKDAQDDVYTLSIKAVDGCDANGKVNVGEPVKGHACADVVFHAWKDCGEYFDPSFFFSFLFLFSHNRRSSSRLVWRRPVVGSSLELRRGAKC